MKPYLMYIRAFARDLNRTAVWTPGNPAVGLGVYGTIEKGEWRPLGDIWGFVKEDQQEAAQMKKENVMPRASLGLGFGRVVGARAGGQGGVGPAAANLEIRFAEADSIYLRACGLTEYSLSNIDLISRCLGSHTEWRENAKRWTFVTCLTKANRLVVLMGGKSGAEARLSADSPELLEALEAGHLSAGAQLALEGTAAVQYHNSSGPFAISLVRLATSWLHPTRPPTAELVVEGFDAESSNLISGAPQEAPRPPYSLVSPQDFGEELLRSAGAAVEAIDG